MLYKLYDPGHTGIIGPRYEHIFRNAALAIMADPGGGSFVDIPKLFRDPAFVDKKLQHVKDQNVIEFWRKEMPQSQRSNDFGEVISWFVSKFGAFLSNEMMRNIIGQTKSSFNLREIMDEGKILLVNLSRGRTGDLNSKLLGMIFVMKFEAAAMSRADVPEDYRRDFCLYVDEFQNFSTESFADILSQARKYHLNLIVANQFTTQLTEEVRDAVFGNVGTVVAFRVGTNDAEFLAKQFAPVFDIDDLQFLPNANTAVRMMIGGVPVQPFSMATLPPLGHPNQQLSDALKQLSWAKYGRPKAEVEKEIFDRLKTEPRPASLPQGMGSPWDRVPGARAGLPVQSSPFGSPPPMPGAPVAPKPYNLPTGQAGPTALQPSPGMPPAASPQGGSFLDEWLAKRKAGMSRGPAPMPPPVSPPALVESALPPRSGEDSTGPAGGVGESVSLSTANPPQADSEGELKIDRSQTPPLKADSVAGSGQGIPAGQTVRIDKDGNLTYGK